MSLHDDAALQAAITKAVMLQEQLDVAQTRLKRERQDRVDAYKVVSVLVERAGGEVCVSDHDLVTAADLVLTSERIGGDTLRLSTKQGTAIENNTVQVGVTCEKCLDTGRIWTPDGQVYCDCKLGKEGEEIGFLDGDEQHSEEFGD